MYLLALSRFFVCQVLLFTHTYFSFPRINIPLWDILTCMRCKWINSLNLNFEQIVFSKLKALGKFILLMIKLKHASEENSF